MFSRNHLFIIFHRVQLSLVVQGVALVDPVAVHVHFVRQVVDLGLEGQLADTATQTSDFLVMI